MPKKNRTYLAVDLKSFYASAECVSRGLDPLKTHLVVADTSRSENTICLAVSPSLKALGVPSRPRYFEVERRLALVNAVRRARAPGKRFAGKSFLAEELQKRPELEAVWIAARPRMAHYIAVSSQVYSVYLRFFAPEDIHVYSIDEVFADITDYLALYRTTPEGLAKKVLSAVLKETGITATAGIGDNLYLAKIAMDIVAKHLPADADGARIARLTVRSYREKLWAHAPLEDFWRIGPGCAARLRAMGLVTMGDIARASLSREDLFYSVFGANAELILDHAWGFEPCSMADIKTYRPQEESLGEGQVLPRAYSFEEAALIVSEMAESLALNLLKKRLVTQSVTLTLGYDRLGPAGPASARGTARLKARTSSARLIERAAALLFKETADPGRFVRRVAVCAQKVRSEDEPDPRQMELFADAPGMTGAEEEALLKKERRVRETVLSIKERFGKNALFAATALLPASTARQRNIQIGGHRA